MTLFALHRSGEHTHTIVGYSLVKGIGDGEPIASERFVVGGWEWVLLFYPDGKRSSSEGPMGNGPAGEVGGHAAAVALPIVGGAPLQAGRGDDAGLDPNEYAALFVALIGEGPNPQGIVSTTEGKVVRAFHRFTLVDQTGQGRDLTKGRTRDAGAVKISCARQDPNARNCHGYRKFVKRSLLEDPSKGYLQNDALVIRYTIELVVSSGGALTRGGFTSRSAGDLVRVPPPSLGVDMAALLGREEGTDVTLLVDGEEFKAHKFLLEARSSYFRSLLNNSMREGREGRAVVHDIRAPVFRALLHFVYTDTLPEGMDDNDLDVEMAQHLLAAADAMALERLRRLCERRLCETVDTETVAFTLALADKNHAEELKKVCLDYVGRNLATVMKTEGYSHMMSSCPGLQAEILSTIAALGGAPAEGRPHGHGGRGGSGGLGGAGGGAGGGRVRELALEAEEVRRVRPRRD
ncbi:hypothetical protein GPECTOR_63g23 [Gonium pectorale]|uniref:BTB domain-containing protein n=1 Tax=Gonium pectorale TaxID=33097 RepID=A0A150G583_GONPE|nr:hypothetical protein GPECTOR_63g23 [Gonium pectorale]|eukprot:KXZ44695.1 hypothetical protein GPECTOR_63g23 [Gonium pectorale]